MVKIDFGTAVPSSERVRIWRIVRKLGQRELAARAGMHYQDIGHVETGKLPLWPKWREAIAAALGVPEADLIPPDPRPIPQQDELTLIARWKPSTTGVKI